MTVYGLTAEGFVEKLAAQILADLGAAQRASSALGPEWVDNAESPAGQLNGIVANALGSVWETAGLVYRSRSPSAATFAGLDALASITGTTRSAATNGTVTLSVSLGAGVTLPAGSLAAVAGQPSNRWKTLAAAVNSSGSTATVTVNAEAEAAGAIVANAGTITSIATPLTGWLGVTNVADAATGSAAEGDPALRARRTSEVYSRGYGTLDAIRREIRAVAGVAVVTLVENDTDVDHTYAGGLPPHSIEAIVQGGTTDAVAAALWASKAGGIRTYGSTSAVVVDAGGASRTVYLTRPTTVDAYAEVTVEIDPATYAGADALKAAVANVTTAQLAGAPIRRSDIFAATRSVAGVIDCTQVRLGLSALGVFGANLDASAREVLKLAVGRVTLLGGAP